MKAFSQSPAKEISGVVTSDGIKSFRYMQVMVAEKSCLRCHGSYETAPRFVRERFPPGHISYDYRLGEVIGAVSAGIPMDGFRQIGVVSFRPWSRAYYLCHFVMGETQNYHQPIKMMSETSTLDRDAILLNGSPPTKDELPVINSFNGLMKTQL